MCALQTTQQSQKHNVTVCNRGHIFLTCTSSSQKYQQSVLDGRTQEHKHSTRTSSSRICQVFHSCRYQLDNMFVPETLFFSLSCVQPACVRVSSTMMGCSLGQRWGIGGGATFTRGRKYDAGSSCTQLVYCTSPRAALHAFSIASDKTTQRFLLRVSKSHWVCLYNP